ncbi:MAG TPA: Rrf2 family transcriptional regulator [Thermodesulfobacteriota bacterium]
MRITNAEDYALRTMLYLASQPVGRFCAIEAIAREQDIPVPFLRKLVKPLQRAGLLVSRRGAEGGVALGRAASSITFRDVLEALDGPIVLQRCVGEAEAADCCGIIDRCRMRGVWQRIQEQLLEALGAVSVGEVAGPPSAGIPLPVVAGRPVPGGAPRPAGA